MTGPKRPQNRPDALDAPEASGVTELALLSRRALDLLDAQDPVWRSEISRAQAIRREGKRLRKSADAWRLTDLAEKVQQNLGLSFGWSWLPAVDRARGVV